MRNKFTILLVLIGSAASAEMQCYVPGDDPLPDYFSATDCLVSARAENDGQQPIETVAYMDLSLNGEVIAFGGNLLAITLPFLLSPDTTPTWYLTARFDSTQFPSETWVEVKMRVLTDLAREVTATRWVQVRNRAVIYGLNEIEKNPLHRSSLQLWIFASEMNHAIQDWRFDKGWTADTVHDKLIGASVFYAHSHGNCYWGDVEIPFFVTNIRNSGTDGQDRQKVMPNLPYTLRLGQDDLQYGEIPQIYETRQVANGSNAPPFNSTGNPPINLSFIDACLTGQNQSLADAFLHPPIDGYDRVLYNRAHIAWRIAALIEPGVASQQAFWRALREGYNVEEACIDLADAYDANANPWVLLSIVGDPYTMLHGLYSGIPNDEPETRWFEQIFF